MTDIPKDLTDCFPGVRPVALTRHDDPRGSLLPVDFSELPFHPKRLFTVGGMAAGTIRGGHSHRHGLQLLIGLRGRIEVLLRHNGNQAVVRLEPDEQGLLVGPGIWFRQTYLDEDSVLLVLASDPYDPDSYVYEEEPQP